MLSIIASVALSFALTGTPAGPVVDAPHCDTMGINFQCDEDRAMELDSVDIWERDFNLTYVTTRLDGVKPSTDVTMTALQDPEDPNMWHVFSLRYAPTLNV